MIREAGDSAVLLELEPVIDATVNARAIAIAGAIRGVAHPAIHDVVSTYRSVAVYFDPLRVAVDEVVRVVEQSASAAPQTASGKMIEVPVVYDGPDLDQMARRAGMAPRDVIARHAAPDYRVFMLGFMPGFAYMGIVDRAIAAPRHATPRLRVKAGSVGIAGRQTGVYPSDSPGGWQLIGRTGLRLFDVDQPTPALFAPGDRVRFVPVHQAAPPREQTTHGEVSPPRASNAPSQPQAVVTVVSPGLMTTIQDAGRWGYQGSGVSVSGALDQPAYRTANTLVGNDDGAACLEAVIIGPELRFEQPATVAIAGADLAAHLDSAPVPVGRAVTCRAGAVLRFGERRHGARSYIAFAGGIDVPLVLGSRSTHALSGIGGTPLRAGQCLAIGKRHRASSRSGTHGAHRQESPPQAGARLRVLAGPQVDAFDRNALDVLQRTRFRISPQSNRMGYRLTGPSVPPATSEMISDASFTGALQVPPSGEPILLMNDRQTVGGYPQLAIVIAADLPLAAQLAPGDWVEFSLCSRSEALNALRAQHSSHA